MAAADSAIIQSLLAPSAYPHQARAIELLQTHISWVLLAGEFAYKIKKPVNFGFVDFSTLEGRRFFCEEELRLNRRLAAELYLGVLPITQTADGLRIGGAGTPVEYCVQMRRFDQQQLLSRVAAADKLTASHVDTLAQEVAQFHSAIPAAPSASRFGSPTAVAEPILANFHSLAQSTDPHVQNRVVPLKDWCERELARLDFAIRERKRLDFVRECHGDMHLGNMILAGDAITIFDCIEFSEDLRWIDVISEAAFCTMDLAHRTCPGFAHRFLNAYLERTGDYGGLALVPMYTVYRALVRAKVLSLQLLQTNAPDDQLRQERDRYIDLAEATTRKPAPFLAITHGVSGSGKTWGSQIILEHLGAVRIRSDIERKRLAGLAPLASSRSQQGEGLYSPAFTQRTYDHLLSLASTILSAGFPAIVDATFLKRAERMRFQELARSRGVPFHILSFPTDAATCCERVRLRGESRSDASEATIEILEQQLRSVEPLDDSERALAVSIDPSVATAPQEALQRLVLD